MENTALKNVYSSEQIHKTSNGIRFKINHLIIKLNYDDVCFICGIKDHVFDNDSTNKELKKIKTSLDNERAQYGDYIPYFRIAEILADHITSYTMPEFTLLLIDCINILKSIVYQRCDDLIFDEMKNLFVMS